MLDKETKIAGLALKNPLLNKCKQIILSVWKTILWILKEAEIFKSFIHLEFIFVYGVRRWLSFTFLHVVVQLSQHHCWRGYFNSILCFWLLYRILIAHRNLGLFLGSLYCSICLCVCCYARTKLFWLQWPCNTVWYQVLWSLLLCSSFSKLL